MQPQAIFNYKLRKNTNDDEKIVLHIEIFLTNAKSLAISFKQTALLEKAEEQKISFNILIQSFLIAKPPKVVWIYLTIGF